MIENVCIGLHVKYTLFLSDFMKLDLLYRSSKNTQIPNYMKICPVGAELFNVDGQTASQTDGRNETNSHFSQFCERA